MKTKAVRLYGVEDLRLEEFELPEMKDDEILAEVISDSLCMSTWKVAHQGAAHKRIPDDVAENPTIMGHEFAGRILKVGKKWQGQFKEGDKFSIQPAMNHPGGPVGLLSAPGYSYRYAGGDATYIIIPREVMEMGCLLPYTGPGFYPASLSEPLSCVIGAIHACYHVNQGSYVHQMDIRENGKMALLAGVGPMGLAMINYVLHREDRHPSLFVVTDIDQARLDRAAELYPVEYAASRGIELKYINTGNIEDPVKTLREISGGTGYDEVVVMAPVPAVVEQADDILGFDGCLNFFSGPGRADFKAPFNFYNVHYALTHVVGTSGGNTDDMKEGLKMMSEGLDPAGLVTHIGGLNVVPETTIHLPEIKGGKKLIYTHVEMPLTAIADFGEKGRTNPVYAELDRLCKAHNGLWNIEAEEYLLSHSDQLL
ncbi:MAG: zinc-binding dehydrogenase [Bacteroidales bacterium]|nr:zinc-binding dehydrogenase [Bacteroidales bacterium]